MYPHHNSLPDHTPNVMEPADHRLASGKPQQEVSLIYVSYLDGKLRNTVSKPKPLFPGAFLIDSMHTHFLSRIFHVEGSLGITTSNLQDSSHSAQRREKNLKRREETQSPEGRKC